MESLLSEEIEIMFHSGDDINAIVADIGTTSCRIGFAGDDTPKSYFPTVSWFTFFVVHNVFIILSYS